MKDILKKIKEYPRYIFSKINRYRVTRQYFRKEEYISWYEKPLRLLKNRKKSFQILDLNEVRRKYKKSDTIFVLGNGPTINDVTEDQWRHIAKCDSIGVNVWPVHKFVPTFYRMKIHEREYLEDYSKAIAENIKHYGNTVFFIHEMRFERGLHPKIYPELFPDEPLICPYVYRGVKIAKDEDFTADNFKDSIAYRGALSITLDIIKNFGYKKIILMGVDLYSSDHFYDSYENMQWQFSSGYWKKSLQEMKKTRHGCISKPKPYKKNIDEFLYALDEIYYKPKGIELFIGSQKSLLYPGIPVYDYLSGDQMEGANEK